MLESFLEVLTRIAVALEAIATTNNQTVSATLPSTPAPKGKSKKAEAASEPVTENKSADEVTEEVKQETKETKKPSKAADDIKFEDVKKAFYGVLGKIKEKNDGDLTEAKVVSAALSAKFVKGGGQPTENNTDPALYGAFLEAIEQAAIDHEV